MSGGKRPEVPQGKTRGEHVCDLIDEALAENERTLGSHPEDKTDIPVKGEEPLVAPNTREGR